MREATLTPQAASMRRNTDMQSSLKHRTPTMRVHALRSRRGIIVDIRTPPFIISEPFCTGLADHSWRACTVCAGYRYLWWLCVMTLSQFFIAYNPASDSDIQGNPGMHWGM